MGLWSTAAEAAAKTPESRNRYVDFLRALSIMAVITGHWLVTAVYIQDNQLFVSNLLAHQEWSKWLTWLFQVMPIFFLVGGYSNGVSWNSAMRSGKSYREWLKARLERLIGPVLPLLVAWGLIVGLALVFAGDFGTAKVLGHAGEYVDKPAIELASQLAIVPTWFLAVYMLVVLLAPLTYGAWKKYGFGSFWALVGAAIVIDMLTFSTGVEVLGYLNFIFIWFSVHQLGYAWRDGRLDGLDKTLAWGVGGLVTLVCLTNLDRFPYPVHMAGNPGEGISNSFPPKLPMLALGLTQCGMLLSLEKPMRRWLMRPKPWTATIIVNGMIMTIYLWHFTALTLVTGLAWKLGNLGLLSSAGSSQWWSARPVWFLCFVVALVVLALGFGRFERGRPGVTAVAAWRQVVGALMLCFGLALLAKDGVVFVGWLNLQSWALALPLGGAWLAGLLTMRSRSRTGAESE
jgi:surface polysaccharide O-acyltransferase-like enzyme